MSDYAGRNRQAANGGPSGVQRSYATQLKESEPLFNSYEHLQGLQRGDAALTMLRKIASLVKPIMRKHGWRVQILAEFLPPEANLLGLNINMGYKICIRLRYHNNPDLFLPTEQVVDTMLHELSHNVCGAHDSRFHKLWDELRDEHEVLVRKGYTGEGFLSEGHRLGGSRYGIPSPHETRRLARASAEKRKAQGALSQGSGRRLGGTPLNANGADMRQIIADQVTRRNSIDRGCASGRSDAGKLSDQSANNTFKTKANEDDANDQAIAQALFDLMEQEEERKLQGTLFATAPPEGGLAWHPETGLYNPSNGQEPRPASSGTPGFPTEEEQMKWAMQDSVVSPASASNTLNSLTFSPVSPLTPERPQRTASAPPLDATETNPPRMSNNLASHSNERPKSHMPPTKRMRPAAQEASSSSHPQPPLPAAPSTTPTSPLIDISEPHNPDQWTCPICTCINPLQYLACDACAIERPQQLTISSVGLRHTRSLGAATSVSPQTSNPRWTIPRPAQSERLGWNCERCGAFMEHKWWTCSGCGLMKGSS